MNKLISDALNIAAPDADPSLYVTTVTLSAPDRGLPLELRVTAPAAGDNLPVVLLSHGGGESLYLASKDGYDPIVQFYAARGFAVMQPTHLSSMIGGFGLNPAKPGHPMFGRARIADMRQILDSLTEIEQQVPGLSGRLDHDSVVAVGHSAGAQTVAVLLGARLKDADGNVIDEDLTEPRIKAGLLLAPTGNGDGLTQVVREAYPELDLDFSHMTTRALVAYGDDDINPAMMLRGADWHADPYHQSPGAEHLITFFGAKHFLGGIMGYNLQETDDENPELLAITQRMTWAYLRSVVDPTDDAWADARTAFEKHTASYGRIDSKS
ncbi:alpha/beta hydrolase family protein [Promicromonospora sp. NPDC090134]|uniref:alpha/beta hydrolase family protein n=1 Tax=Promicromonospora sp. NPDC090134 TaxID=3364408 RepID=UPI0038286066